MEYLFEVQTKINLVNSLFESIDIPSISLNNDFVIYNEFHFPHYVKFILTKPSCVQLELIFMADALQINIDRTNESYEWSTSQIEKNTLEVEKMLNMIFTSTIKVEHCGRNFTKIFYYDENGTCLKTSRFITGLYLRIGCSTKIYPPIYRKLNFNMIKE